ncbi:MAG: DNA repair exonuclease [Clostridia bacterium]|nr:DNA repair exonuclease [Clostridia bacterium]
MRFLHTADLHLDAPVIGLPQRAAVRRGGLEALRRMIDYATEAGIRFFVIAGDLFDSPHPSAAVRGAVQTMFENAPALRFLIAAGNHDPLPKTGDWCGMNLPENVYLFPGELTEIAFPGITFAGASLTAGNTTHPFAALPTKTGLRVGVFHGSVGDGEPAYRLDAALVKESGMDYIALGHIHKPADPVQLGQSVVATPGSPAAHGFDETGKRSFLDVIVNETGVSATRVRLDGICFYEETLTVDEQATQGDILGKMTALCAAHGEKDIYRFRVQGVTAHTIPTALPDYPGLVEVSDETTLPLSLDSLAEERSLRGFFVKGMLEKIAAADGERKLLESALRLGLEAFE